MLDKNNSAMATVANAFNLLTGAEQQLASKKKKKNNKAKAEANGNGAVPHPPAQPAVAAAPPAAAAPAAALPAANLVVGVSEACAIFERAAREARSLSDKVKLWKDWTRLVSQPMQRPPLTRESNGWQWHAMYKQVSRDMAVWPVALHVGWQGSCWAQRGARSASCCAPSTHVSPHTHLQAGDKSAKSLKYTDVDDSHLDFKQVRESGRGRNQLPCGMLLLPRQRPGTRSPLPTLKASGRCSSSMIANHPAPPRLQPQPL